MSSCCVLLAEGEDIMNSDGSKCSLQKAIARVLQSSSIYKDTKFLLILHETNLTYSLYVCNLHEKRSQILYLSATTAYAMTIKVLYEVWINYPCYNNN